MMPLHYFSFLFHLKQKEALTWLRKYHVETYQIENTWFLDETGFQKVIQINLLLSRYGGFLRDDVISGEKNIDNVVNQLGHLAFLLTSLEKISPSLRLLIQEIACSIPDELNRNIFVDIFSGIKIPYIAKKYGMKINEVYNCHESTLYFINQKLGFIKNDQDSLIQDELTGGKPWVVNKIQANETERFPEIQSDIDMDRFCKCKHSNSSTVKRNKDLGILSLGLQGNFGLNKRTINCLSTVKIITVEDLLRFIDKNDVYGLFKIPYFGGKSVQDLKEKMIKAGILDDSWKSNLSRYL